MLCPIASISPSPTALAGTDPAQVSVQYVGKHGNDSNDGTHPDRAKLTIQAAYESLAPSNSGKIAVLDGGAYVENLDFDNNSLAIHLDAPSAELYGTITLSNGFQYARIDLLSHIVFNAAAEYGVCVGFPESSSVNRLVYNVGTAEFTASSGSTAAQLDGFLLQPSAGSDAFELEINLNRLLVRSQGVNTFDVTGIRMNAPAFPGSRVAFNINSMEVRGGNGSGFGLVAESGELDIDIKSLEVLGATATSYDTTAGTGTIRGFIGDILSGAENPTNGGTVEILKPVPKIVSTAITSSIDFGTDILLVTAGGTTQTLPPLPSSGNQVIIKRTSSGGGATTIDTPGAELVEGAASVSLPNNSSYTLVSDGTGWWIV